MRRIGMIGFAETIHAGFLYVATGVQRVVVVKPETGTVILVRTTTRDRIEHRARVPTILGAELVSDEPDLLNRVRIVQRDRRSGDTEVVVILTVDHEVVGAGAAAIRREVCSPGEGALARVQLAHARC